MKANTALNKIWTSLKILCVYVRAHMWVHVSYCLILNEDVCFVLNILTGDILLQKYLYKYAQEEIWHTQYSSFAI